MNLIDILDAEPLSGPQIIRSTGLSAPALTRQSTAYGLQLFSRSEGQGRNRDYCLADACQLSLAAWFSQLTPRAQKVAVILNRLAGFKGAESSIVGDVEDKSLRYLLLDDPENDRLRISGASSIRALPEIYWDEEEQIRLHVWPNLSGFSVLKVDDHAIDDGLYLNVSHHLRQLRTRLAREVERAATDRRDALKDEPVDMPQPPKVD